MSEPASDRGQQRWRRVDAILEAALDAAPAERAALVSRSCAGDADLEREILGLLAADEQAGGFLEPRAGDEATGGALSAPQPLADGVVLLGRYRISARVGHGGMGAVYRARDLVLETDVALKVLDPRLLARDGRMEAFRREVRLARLVTHPNVCRVHDIVEGGGLAFLTMEYVPGQSLAERLDGGAALPLAASVRVLSDVLHGLSAAHAAGVIHRDLKPGNVLLREATGEAVVADFGVAAEAEGGERPEERAGTRGYMAPEQARGAAPDVKSDLYSLGVLAHRIATGALPGESASQELPGALVPLVSACLQPEPRDRPAGARAALRLLERADATRARALRVAAAVVVAIGLVGFWMSRVRPTTTGAVRELAVGPVDTSRLEAGEGWLGGAFQGLLVDELSDAWSLDARAARAESAERSVRSRLWREAGGQLRVSITLPDGGPSLDVPAGALHELAQRAALRVVETLVPVAGRNPTAQQLREVGARDPEAWRQFRRAQRAARMEHWARVRALAQDAVRRDPTFCRAWLELDLTYNKEDQARLPILDKVLESCERAQGLSAFSRQAVEFARQSRRQDPAGVAQAMQGLMALELEGQDLLYLKTRVAFSLFSQGEPDSGLPLLEWVAEKWPQDPAAHKKLADYYVGVEEPVSLPLALRHGERAVALAPEDVAARANLARALLLSGDERAARSHLAILVQADPADKQGAFLGERLNRLFALHMVLGDLDEAAADARRLKLDPGLSNAQGRAALAVLALSRGAFDEGLEGLLAVAGEYERLHIDAMAQIALWEYAWHAHALGRQPLVVAAAERARRMRTPLYDSLGAKYARRTQALATLVRLETEPLARGAASAALLRRELGEPSVQGEWRRWPEYFDLLIRHRQKDWAGVLAAYRELETPTPPLAVTFEAADACERLGQRPDAARLFERLATDRNAWQQPFRRGQAWVRLGRLREQAGDVSGARQAYAALLRMWDRADPDTPEIRHAEGRLKVLPNP